MAPVISHARRRRRRYVRLQRQQQQHKSDRISRLNAKHTYTYVCINCRFCCYYSPCALALALLFCSRSPNFNSAFCEFCSLTHNLNGIIYMYIFCLSSLFLLGCCCCLSCYDYYYYYYYLLLLLLLSNSFLLFGCVFSVVCHAGEGEGEDMDVTEV